MNGTIQSKIKTGGGSNPVTGEPIAVGSSWGEPVECKYKANVLSNKGSYLGGTFQQASFEITTMDMDFQTTIIRLFDNRNNLVCEKEVMSLEVLEFVQRVKIVI